MQRRSTNLKSLHQLHGFRVVFRVLGTNREALNRVSNSVRRLRVQLCRGNNGIKLSQLPSRSTNKQKETRHPHKNKRTATKIDEHAVKGRRHLASGVVTDLQPPVCLPSAAGAAPDRGFPRRLARAPECQRKNSGVLTQTHRMSNNTDGYKSAVQESASERGRGKRGGGGLKPKIKKQ